MKKFVRKLTFVYLLIRLGHQHSYAVFVSFYDSQRQEESWKIYGQVVVTLRLATIIFITVNGLNVGITFHCVVWSDCRTVWNNLRRGHLQRQVEGPCKAMWFPDKLWLMMFFSLLLQWHFFFNFISWNIATYPRRSSLWKCY